MVLKVYLKDEAKVIEKGVKEALPESEIFLGTKDVIVCLTPDSEIVLAEAIDRARAISGVSCAMPYHPNNNRIVLCGNDTAKALPFLTDVKTYLTKEGRWSNFILVQGNVRQLRPSDVAVEVYFRQIIMKFPDGKNILAVPINKHDYAKNVEKAGDSLWKHFGGKSLDGSAG